MPEFGWKHSLKTRRRMKLIMENVWKRRGYRKRISRMRKIAAKEPKRRKQLLSRLKKAWKAIRGSEKIRKQRSLRMKKYWKNPNSKFRKAFYETDHTSDNQKIAARKTLKRLMKDPSFVKKSRKGWASPSKPQISLFRRLCRLGYSGIRLEYQVGRYFLDMAFPATKLAVEFDGEYWHDRRDRPDIRKRDRRRNRYLCSRGWKVFHYRSKKHSQNLVEFLGRKGNHHENRS